ncbi:MAG: RraA family protein [Pirellulaceae bacterium]
MDDNTAILEQLYSAVVADALDSMGLRHQILSADIRALTPTRKVCGRVFTAKAVAVNEMPAEPYKLEMQAIDTMQAGDVLVVDAEHEKQSAFWGELLSTACLAKGVRGIVMSACSRDMRALHQMGFPVFGIGCTPADSAGRLDVVSIGEPIQIDGVAAKHGDTILGDRDGVVIVPQESADEALRRATEKVSAENTVREELRAGVPVAEVFRKHGIL